MAPLSENEKENETQGFVKSIKVAIKKENKAMKDEIKSLIKREVKE